MQSGCGSLLRKQNIVQGDQFLYLLWNKKARSRNEGRCIDPRGVAGRQRTERQATASAAVWAPTERSHRWWRQRQRGRGGMSSIPDWSRPCWNSKTPRGKAILWWFWALQSPGLGVGQYWAGKMCVQMTLRLYW